ncbi:protein TonB [Sphingomonas laterariae]|uniref:Protein TonB n=1 Tax=Edaphosphingomonas laterariae TaxID=861865 RepID=A0A239H5Q4_9SPHN|nr:hypothetical protein [Sphingomonas laterariae]SNS76542.1 protein TonB [Sphingomonas laterariae]
MRLALSSWVSDLRGASGRRASALVFVVLLHALLLFLLLRFAPEPLLRSMPGGPLVVELIPAPKAEVEKTATQEKRVERVTRQPKPSEVTAEKAPLSKDIGIWAKVVPLTSEEFAAADISKMPRRSRSSEGGEGDAQASAAAGGSGTGVGSFNGETLFNADWYRPPSHAELAAYMPSSAPRVGWGMVACRTAKGFRVEDCQEIGQYPAGSGFASAVRQAAWQFRVLPPRIGGRPQIGVWVRIRIEYTEKGVSY